LAVFEWEDVVLDICLLDDLGFLVFGGVGLGVSLSPGMIFDGQPPPPFGPLQQDGQPDFYH